MYLPKHFAVTDQAALFQFVGEFPFATLVSHNLDGLNAEHIPMALRVDQDQVFLEAHIAKANPLWQTLADQADVLVIFQAENAYISPNWYPSKKVDGKVVPTWNYRAVHIKGSIRFIHDTAWKRSFLDKLTQIHEQSQPAPWAVSDAPQDYIEKRLLGIVGVEIVVSEIQGKFKLSQNQPLDNKNGVQQGLRQAQHSMAQSIQQPQD